MLVSIHDFVRINAKLKKKVFDLYTFCKWVYIRIVNGLSDNRNYLYFESIFGNNNE